MNSSIIVFLITFFFPTLLTQVIFPSPSTKVTPEDTISILTCAGRGLLFSPPDQECHLPTSQGPCGEGEMVVLGREGVGECVGNPCAEQQLLWTGEECVDMFGQEGCGGRGERLLYNVTGGVECGCEEGWGRVGGGGVCHQHSTQGPCKQGDMVLESDNASYCGEEASCVHHQSCPIFLSDMSILSQYTMQTLQYQTGVARLSAQVCSKQLLHVCCQTRQTLTDTLQLSEILHMLARHHRTHMACYPSPGHGQQQDTDMDITVRYVAHFTMGYYNHNYIIRRVPLVSHKCAQGKIWSKFRRRCVKSFF